MTPLATLHDRRRSSERREVEIDATVRVDGHPLDAIIFNMSATGCLFYCSERLDVGETMTIGIAGVGRKAIQIVRVAHSRYGAEFEVPLTPSDMTTAANLLGNMVIALPNHFEEPWSSDDELPELQKLPFPVRALIVAGVGIVSWAAIFAIIRSI